MAEKAYYILVESSTAGWALYTALREAGCVARIAPVPRGLQACCGVSLLLFTSFLRARRPQHAPAPALN